jgi:hypothetical protein
MICLIEDPSARRCTGVLTGGIDPPFYNRTGLAQPKQRTRQSRSYTIRKHVIPLRPGAALAVVKLTKENINEISAIGKTLDRTTQTRIRIL